MTAMIKTFEIAGPDPDQEPTNAIRSSRIDLIFEVCCAVLGEQGDTVDEFDVASLLTDIRHWCDRENVDIYRALDLSYENYIAERVRQEPSFVEEPS